MNTIEVPAAFPPEGYSCLYRDSFINQLKFQSLSQIARDEDCVTVLRMLQVRCPHCQATPMQWCTYPKGTVALVLHAARMMRAITDRWWQSPALLQVPEVHLTREDLR